MRRCLLWYVCISFKQFNPITTTDSGKQCNASKQCVYPPCNGGVARCSGTCCRTFKIDYSSCSAYHISVPGQQCMLAVTAHPHLAMEALPGVARPVAVRLYLTIRTVLLTTSQWLGNNAIAMAIVRTRHATEMFSGAVVPVVVCSTWLCEASYLAYFSVWPNMRWQWSMRRPAM